MKMKRFLKAWLAVLWMLGGGIVFFGSCIALGAVILHHFGGSVALYVLAFLIATMLMAWALVELA